LRAERGPPSKPGFGLMGWEDAARGQMPFETTRLAGGLERKRQDLWNAN